MLKIVDRVLKYMIPTATWSINDSDGIYLTFDDGPTPGVTEWILATLEKYDAKATFFSTPTSTKRLSLQGTKSAITPTPTKRDGVCRSSVISRISTAPMISYTANSSVRHTRE